jgi:hypothetical protein
LRVFEDTVDAVNRVVAVSRAASRLVIGLARLVTGRT